MKERPTTTSKSLFSLDLWRMLREYTGVGKGLAGGAGRGALDSPTRLGEFLNARASHVAQSALYGYLKTRAGTRFPELFEHPGILASVNIAKWHIWLACLSDLAVYSGVLLRQQSDAPDSEIRALLGDVIAAVLAEVGMPDEAGDEFAAATHAINLRVAQVDLAHLGDDESAFTRSPRALAYWAPIADELKKRDVEIIHNSVRFRWQEIRRILRKQLRAPALLAASARQTRARKTSRAYSSGI